MDKLKPNVTLHTDRVEDDKTASARAGSNRIFDYLQHRNNLYVLARKAKNNPGIEIICAAFIEDKTVEFANKASIKVLHNKGLISFPFVEFEIND